MAVTVLTLLILCSLAISFTPSVPILSCRWRTAQLSEHPAVLGWPNKYAGGSSEGRADDKYDDTEEERKGPRVISNNFVIETASPSQLIELDTLNWPTWTTSDKPKWNVGNKVKDKEMPYGELSFVIAGKLEIIPQSTGAPEIIGVGDFVTFPKGFVASWRVLEELTWHYYLY
jgi:hypothetical protein